MAVVVVAPRARTQIRHAVDYWEREHPGERSRLADEVARALELLADFPDMGIGVGRRGHRRLLLPDVGYHIVATGDKAHVTNMASVDIW